MWTQSWADAYHELWRQAAHHRGLREAIGELPGHTLSHELRQWPRTCGSDVVAIAAVIDPLMRAAPLELGGYGVERRWRQCTRVLAGVALGEPTREYHHNREFWSTLASIAAYLGSTDVPVPEAMWPGLLVEVAARELAHRNGAVGGVLRLQSYSYGEMWSEQRAAFAELRGSDRRGVADAVSCPVMSIPRTTNADVLEIGIYWYEALAQAELARLAHGAEGDHALRAAGLDGEIRRAIPIFSDLDTYAAANDPDAVYLENESFWRGLASLAATLSAIDPAPPVFEMHMDAAGRASRTRNASYPGAGAFEQKWDKEHDELIASRGFDLREPLPDQRGRPMKIPRTLNAEIVKLADSWNTAWKHLDGRRGFFGDLPGEEVGLDTLEKHWKAVMKDVRELAEPGKVDAIYSKNHEFWRETLELARVLDGYNEVPSRADIAADVAKTLPDRVGDVVSRFAHALGDLAHKAGEGAASGFGKPFLIGGGVILSGFLLWRFLRRPRLPEVA